LKRKRKRAKRMPVFVFFCVYAAFQGLAYSAAALVKVQMKRLQYLLRHGLQEAVYKKGHIGY
jgi:hypothetical protein